MQNRDLLGETKLVPPRKGKVANYLSIKHVYLRIARGDLLERMGQQQFLNYAGGYPATLNQSAESFTGHRSAGTFTGQT